MEPRSYRMVASTKQDYVAAAMAERQLYDWLSVKRHDTSALDEGRNDIAANVTLDHDAASGRHGAYARWRLRGTMPNNAGTWQSTLVIRADHREDNRHTWIQVDTERRPALSDGLPKPAKTPRIARLLLTSLDAQDGLAAVDTSPAFIEPADIDEVIEELCDQDRRLPIAVATVSYGKDTVTWTSTVVETAFAQLPGSRSCTYSRLRRSRSSTGRWSTTPSSSGASAPTSPASTSHGSPMPSATR
ncbi:hypothetical protein [Streptomyces sp. NPDC002209]|uniref:hypothetical protein n=1 Tax=Streptomyces sp. NPDC002209 TaxID=3364638 RepID=UPI0036CC71B5